MRIVYGVFGYGRGHATRALSVLPALTERHEIRLFAGGDAYEAIGKHFAVRELPSVAYVYGAAGERSLRRTFERNFLRGCDIVFGGSEMTRLLDELRDFAPEVAIVDAEPWMHWAAARLGIPRISFDHFGVLAHCDPIIHPMDRLRVMRDVAGYRLWVRRPERVIVSSFYPLEPRDPSVRVVGPLTRDEVRAARPTLGDHLLVYLNNGDRQLGPHIEHALRALGLPVIVYGTSRRGVEGRLDFRAPSQREFVDDLASCRALFSTAGNQLVGEAITLRKPMLVMPEHTVEQRTNALSLAAMGFGRWVHRRDVDAQVLRRFLDDAPSLAAAIPAARDGNAEAIAALEEAATTLAAERRRRALVPSGARQRRTGWRFA
jgi:uncharacterized protein (TIGR00661 family)